MDILSIAEGKHTEAEVADFVLRHLIKQGVPAVGLKGNCYYRTPSGLTCAAGCLIPEKLYRPSMEGASSHDVFEKMRWVKGTLRLNDSISDLIRDLQKLHDAHSFDPRATITPNSIRYYLDDIENIRDVGAHSTKVIRDALNRIEANLS